jgi:CheY-like chemotaxis protein
MNPSLDIPRHPARILIVDDERDNRELLEIILTSEGFVIQTAASGEEALDAVTTQTPDLILLDVMMPGMNGYDVVTKIKGDIATKSIPVIMVSALNDTTSRMRAESAGADGFLSKPIDCADLCGHVRTALGRGRPPRATG